MLYGVGSWVQGLFSEKVRTYFLHISSRMLGIYFKIIEVEYLLRCHTYKAKEVSDLLQDHRGWKLT